MDFCKIVDVILTEVECSLVDFTWRPAVADSGGKSGHGPTSNFDYRLCTRNKCEML